MSLCGLTFAGRRVAAGGIDFRPGAGASGAAARCRAHAARSDVDQRAATACAFVRIWSSRRFALALAVTITAGLFAADAAAARASISGYRTANVDVTHPTRSGLARCHGPRAVPLIEQRCRSHPRHRRRRIGRPRAHDSARRRELRRRPRARARGERGRARPPQRRQLGRRVSRLLPIGRICLSSTAAPSARMIAKDARWWRSSTNRSRGSRGQADRRLVTASGRWCKVAIGPRTARLMKAARSRLSESSKTRNTGRSANRHRVLHLRAICAAAADARRIVREARGLGLIRFSVTSARRSEVSRPTCRLCGFSRSMMRRGPVCFRGASPPGWRWPRASSASSSRASVSTAWPLAGGAADPRNRHSHGARRHASRRALDGAVAGHAPWRRRWALAGLLLAAVLGSVTQQANVLPRRDVNGSRNADGDDHVDARGSVCGNVVPGATCDVDWIRRRSCAAEIPHPTLSPRERVYIFSPVARPLEAVEELTDLTSTGASIQGCRMKNLEAWPPSKKSKPSPWERGLG